MMNAALPLIPSHVQDIFNALPTPISQPLLNLRRLIFEVAAETAGVGPLTETLKWGDPSYLTEISKSGSLVRLNKRGNGYALFFHCQTNLVSTFRDLYPNLTYEANRAILFRQDDQVPEDVIKDCIRRALTYKLAIQH